MTKTIGLAASILLAAVGLPGAQQPATGDLKTIRVLVRHSCGRDALHVHGPGCERVTRIHTPGADLVSGQWKNGRIGVVRGIRDGASLYGQVVFGPKAVVSAPPANASGTAAKRSSYYGLVSAAIEFFRTGRSPVPIDETVEIMAFMEAADLSKARNGAPVAIAEVMRGR